MGRPETGYVIARAVVLAWLKGVKIHLEGIENIPSDGAAIVASNHISFFDPLAVAYAVHRRGRRPRFLGKSTLFKIPAFGWILRSARQIPVERGTSRAVNSLEHAVRAVKDGEVLVIFPEGSIPLNERLDPLPPKSGVARLALQTSMPIIPCATWGGQWIWGYHQRFGFGLGKDVWARVGRPIPLESFRGREDDPEAWDEIGALVMKEIELLLVPLKAAKPWEPRRLTKPGRKKLAQKGQASSGP